MKWICANWRLKCGENLRLKLTVVGETGPKCYHFKLIEFITIKISLRFIRWRCFEINNRRATWCHEGWEKVQRLKSKLWRMTSSQTSSYATTAGLKCSNKATIPSLRCAENFPTQTAHTHTNQTTVLAMVPISPCYVDNVLPSNLLLTAVHISYKQFKQQLNTFLTRH